jgi:uncharacterized protein
MLRVEFRALDKGSVDVDGTVSVADLGFEESDPVIVGPAHVVGRLSCTSTGQYFWLGRVEAAAKLDCRRCLCEVTTPLDVPVEVMFVESGEADDANIYVLDPQAPVLDLSEMIREELVLATPEWVLCRDACKGLCAGCGNDLNAGTCDCAQETDPRWAALEALKTDSLKEGS